MKMAFRLGCSIAGLATIAVLFFVPTASAQAATSIGQTFAPNANCFGDNTFIQSTSPNGQYRVPFDGVISSWSFQADASPPQVKLKVARGAGGSNFFIVGQSEPRTPAPLSTSSFETRISVQAGNLIGLSTVTGGFCQRTGVAGYAWNNGAGDPQPGSTVPLGNSFHSKLDIAAVLEQDSDTDGFGDETQDKCVGTAGTFNGCPSTVAIDSAKQKGKKPKIKVTSTVPGAGTLQAGSANDASLASASGSKTLKAVSQTITATSTQHVALTLKLTKSAKKKLANKGKLKTQVKVVYTPTGGPAASQTANVKLKS